MDNLKYFQKKFFHGLDFSNVASLLSLNQPKISAREFCSIFITIFVWNKCKNLFHLHQYPKYNFLTLDYMIHFFLSTINILCPQVSETASQL